MQHLVNQNLQPLLAVQSLIDPDFLVGVCRRIALTMHPPTIPHKPQSIPLPIDRQVQRLGHVHSNVMQNATGVSLTPYPVNPYTLMVCFEVGFRILHSKVVSWQKQHLSLIVYCTVDFAVSAGGFASQANQYVAAVK